MHEATIAAELIRQTLEAIPVSPTQGRLRVEQIEVEIGPFRQVVPEALGLAWQMASEGTPAEGSRLSIREVLPAARCRLCGGEFEPKIDNYLCPKCNQADVEITAGNDIILMTVTCLPCEGPAGP